METRSYLEIVRDALAVVRDVLLIAAMAGLFYFLVIGAKAVSDWHQQLNGIAS